MADEFQLGSGNWWDTSRTAPSSISTTLNTMASSFSWPSDLPDTKSRSSMDSSGAAPGSGFSQDVQNPNLHMMGLGLSSQGLDWNNNPHFLGGGEKAEASFRSMLQEDSSNFQHKLYSGAGSSDDSSVNRGFSLDQPGRFSCSQASSNDSTITCQNLTASFQMDSSSAAAYGLMLSENQGQLNYPYPSSSSYGAELMAAPPPSWNKFPQFLRTSPPKQQQLPPPFVGSSHLHFTNNTRFWNASPAVNDARSSFFPAEIPAAPTFHEKPKNTSEGGVAMKKNSTEASSNKRPRNETPSPLPAFKVRKEKMGDRITALQQLVSPFGKTDTASVLSEAIEYIKFLHEQVSMLSAPYMKNGAPIQQQKSSEKAKDLEGQRQDLRSRGLCLVPVSSTFPETHETTVDFWTPTFGGTFR